MSEAVPVIIYLHGVDSWYTIVGAFAKLQKATVKIRHVRLSARDNSAPTGRIFMKLDIWDFFRKSVEKIQMSLKSDKNKEYFTWMRFDIFDDIALNSS